MKKLKQIIEQIKNTPENSGEFNDLLWQMICYPPKMPVRFQYEQLLNEAEKFSLDVEDEYFAHRTLSFNGFKWGNSPHKIFITHGWGSKAADFGEIIAELRKIDDLQIIVFDAPGNGSSASELSNLILFILSVKAVINTYGTPDIIIGHSLGVMANIIALDELKIAPKLLISITPLVGLKENFVASMTTVGVSPETQTKFLNSFEDIFKMQAASFNLVDRYKLSPELSHWLAYDENDQVAPYPYLKDFLEHYPSIDSRNYDGAGHERILKSPELIGDLISNVKSVL